MSRILREGKPARVRLYQSLLERISKGEVLKPTELRTFSLLEKELDEAGADPAPDVFQSLRQAAEYAGVSKTTIKYHLDRRNIRVGPDKKLTRKAVDAWLAGRSSAGRGGDRRKKVPDEPGEAGLGADKDAADLRYRLAKAEREEFLVAQLKERVVSWEKIEREWAARVAAVGDGLTALADRLPPLLEGRSRAEMQDIIRDEIRTIREAYAREGRYCPKLARD